jgi:hypothetical protein
MILAIIGVGLMIEGNIFGDRTMPAAIVFGIVGISLITISSPWKTKDS